MADRVIGRLAAAKVRGIMTNIKSPAEFLHDNLAIQNNVIHCAYKYKAKKTTFFSIFVCISQVVTTANERRVSNGR